MTKYKLDKMKRLGMTEEEFEKNERELKQENKLKRKIGYKKYYKLKAFNMTTTQIEEYLIQEKRDKELKKQIGYKVFEEMKKSNAKTIEEYEKYKQDKKEIKRQEKSYKQIQKHEKAKVRFRTIRYIERNCNIERKCQICEEKAEVHHPNYKEYLKINLLCKKHHVALHNFELIPPPIIDLEKICRKRKEEN